MPIELKDGIALVALGMGAYSLYLHWDRNQREKRASDPAIDIQITPHKFEPNCWTCSVAVTNRQQATLTIRHLRIVKPAHLNFLLSDPDGGSNRRRDQHVAIGVGLSQVKKQWANTYLMTTDDPITAQTTVVFELTTATHGETEVGTPRRFTRTLAP